MCTLIIINAPGMEAGNVFCSPPEGGDMRLSESMVKAGLESCAPLTFNPEEPAPSLIRNQGHQNSSMDFKDTLLSYP